MNTALLNNYYANTYIPTAVAWQSELIVYFMEASILLYSGPVGIFLNSEFVPSRGLTLSKSGL